MVTRGRRMLLQILYGTLLTALALSTPLVAAHDTDHPVIEAVIDLDSGAELWTAKNHAAPAALKPGQKIRLMGHGFGPGPITVARPGLGPPAGGVSPGGGTTSVTSAAPEVTNKELSKVLFGNVRAF